MRVLIQRVKKASVSVSDNEAASISAGMLLLVGIGKQDSGPDIDNMAKKVMNLRIFEDNQKKMNLNILQVKGEILSVPQFTLYADTKRGNRPGFDSCALPDMAKDLWDNFNLGLKKMGATVKKGVFGEHMNVSLVNDGPVTIWLDSED